MSTVISTAPGRRRFSEDELLDAALATFEARGYEAAQMSDIAERAGTTKPTLYARLGGKEQIYLRVLEREAERLKAVLADAYKQAAELPLHEMVALAVRAFVDFARERPGGFDLLFRAEPPGPGLEIGKRAVDQITDHIAELVAAPILRSGRTPGASIDLLAAASAGVAIQVCCHALDNDFDLSDAEALATAYIEAATRRIDVRVLKAIDRTQDARRPRAA